MAALLLCLLATVLAYWVGLRGPFLFDDFHNLAPALKWTEGQASWREVVFNNDSGILSRPLSMASFLLSTALGGFNTFSFKLGNLILHLAGGVLAWLALRRLLARDPRLAPRADAAAIAIAAIWLLHPINASTVLYAVQRMAQLSTLFVLAALWAYLVGREHLQQHRTARALVWLFVLLPLLTLAGLLCKENAAVLPLLCLVTELAYFQRQTPNERRIVAGFYAAFLALPLALGAAWLTRGGGVASWYGYRDFTLGERLLSQGRALMDYVGTLLLPQNHRLGIVTDDFAISTGLMSPPTTLLALLVLAAISLLALYLRRTAPAIFAGWFFYLAAHSVESGIFPLELYFEHRNYLPAFGLWLAVLGLLELATRGMTGRGLNRLRLGAVLAVAFVSVLAFATHGRARVWQDEGSILEQALKSHPRSPRAMINNFEYGLRVGDRPRSEDALRRMLASDDPRLKMLGLLARVRQDCVLGSGASLRDLQAAVALAQPKAQIPDYRSMMALQAAESQFGCGEVDALALASAAAAIADAATQMPDTEAVKWRLRFLATQLYGRAGRWDLALPQGELAWQPGADAPAGAMLARAYAHRGMKAEAERTYREVDARTDPYNQSYRKGLQELRRFLDQVEYGVAGAHRRPGG